MPVTDASAKSQDNLDFFKDKTLLGTSISTGPYTLVLEAVKDWTLLIGLTLTNKGLE